mmetsp:Transcript_829/g.1621  ORF Transcript_829/g.1621 Transcript_829/m.1621 type:complete len:85 (+) Transcript_829:620-874(+)
MMDLGGLAGIVDAHSVLVDMVAPQAPVVVAVAARPALAGGGARPVLVDAIAPLALVIVATEATAVDVVRLGVSVAQAAKEKPQM